MRDPIDEWFAVSSVVAQVDHGVSRVLRTRYGLGLTEFRALRLLTAAPDRELRVHELAAAVGLDQSSVTRLLSRLEAKGLTRRDLCAEDGRGVYAVVTDAGSAIVEDARNPLRERLTELVADLSPAPGTPRTVEVDRALAALRGLAGS